MNILVILIPVSLILGALGLIGFIWTVRSDQYDDEQGNAARILLDDDER
ncbi:cbb3-type cytochrome oxidase assembly protein CcoS [Sulfitobacter sp.]|jgi:cbb3-type cytochrome oxidase maturation protein